MILEALQKKKKYVEAEVEMGMEIGCRFSEI